MRELKMCCRVNKTKTINKNITGKRVFGIAIAMAARLSSI